MMALARYLFVYYMRSYRYLAPMLAFFGGIIFLYSEVPSPVMDSYAFTSMWLFVISAWLANGFVNLEHESQRFVTVIYTRNVTYYYAIKLLLLKMLCIVLALFATAYPIVFDKFDRTPSVAEAVIAWLCHVVIAALGIACALFFSDKRLSRKALSLLGLLAVLALSLAGQGLINQLPDSLDWIVWIVPPAYRIADLLIRFHELQAGTIFRFLLYATAYSALLAAAFVRVSRRILF